MSTRAVATFENLAEEQTPYDTPDEGPTLFRATLQRRFQGDLVGESVAALLICPSAPDQVGYVGTDRFVGRLGEREGSFVFQHGGAIERGVLRPFGYIVPGSGTGDLRGLRGEASISVSAAGAHTLTLAYDFEA
jgi:Protein of unknown function (DUF3224)